MNGLPGLQSPHTKQAMNSSFVSLNCHSLESSVHPRSTLWTGRELLIQNASGENAALKAGLVSPGFHLLLDSCPVIFNFPDRSLMISNKLKTNLNTHTCAHNTSPVFLAFLGIRVGPNYLVCRYWKWVSIISVVFLHMPS